MTEESPFSLTALIPESVFDLQLLGTVIYSVESNLIISLGEIVNRYFQTYPSPLLPAFVGSKSVNVGSSCDILPFGAVPLPPLSMQEYTLKSELTTK